MKLRPLCFCVLALPLMSGCDRDAIETYRIPKEDRAAAAVPTTPAVPGAQKEVTWKLPAHWAEQPPSPMRVGSFQVKGKTGQADISVIPLSGEAGGDLANINRWRGQIGLPALPESALAQQSHQIRRAGRPMRFVDYTHQNKRLVAAIFTTPAKSWFFKMTGDAPTVGESLPAFHQFLESLQFHGQ